ncbi:hypothetical protein ACHAW6_005551 [Cyclotella cf. meneghiniana]
MKKQMLSFKAVVAAQFSVVAANYNTIRGAKPCGSRSRCNTQGRYKKRDNASIMAKSRTNPLRNADSYISAMIDGGNSTDKTSNFGRPAKWTTIVSEDFNRGLGVFQAGSKDTIHYKQTEDRKGVARIQGGEGLSPVLMSNTIGLYQSVSMFRVIFSFYGLGIEDADSFCLDHSLDGGASWSEEKCWNSCEDFRNNVWYDDEMVKFTTKDADRLRIRLRCNGGDTKDDILIDKIEIQVS